MDFTFSKISATLIIEVIYSFLLTVIPHARDAISGYEELIQPDKGRWSSSTTLIRTVDVDGIDQSSHKP